jgi:Holliday junction resolvasome RuvABC ATP-dependent DNA helicase subunit
MNDAKLSESEKTVPQTLEEFIGQERLKARLEVAIKGAQRRGCQRAVKTSQSRANENQPL